MDHDIGSIITGLATFMFLFLEITGLILWLPKELKAGRRWNARNRVLLLKHLLTGKGSTMICYKSLGFYTFLIVTLLALTGPVLGFEWYRKGFNQVLGMSQPQRGGKDPQSNIPNDSLARPLTVSQWLGEANSTF